MSKKTQQKKQAERKERIRQEKHRKNKKTTNTAKLQAKVLEQAFPDSEMKFWAANGVNHILSNYKDGVWSPMFPQIYEGVEIGYEEMANSILSSIPENTEWPKEHKVALAWITQPRNVIFGMYLECLKLQKETDPDNFTNSVREPHNPIFWERLNKVVEKMV